MRKQAMRRKDTFANHIFDKDPIGTVLNVLKIQEKTTRLENDQNKQKGISVKRIYTCRLTCKGPYVGEVLIETATENSMHLSEWIKWKTEAISNIVQGVETPG